ncbi:SdiA-regulated domain-containing protein [Algoriphagus sp. SE2]|uniref:SdiA-regulated domain-containing protein n=1 Tax=Algoriphagus sp. SE2 TaxID=3141536 RepID=UPI0031CD4ABF
MNHISIISLFSFFVLSQCYPKTEGSFSYSFPDRYSLEEMEKVNLPKKLEEISGIEWISENKLWAIEDESSVIYVLNPNTAEITTTQKFAKNADIEEIMVYNNDAWALKSNGDIYQISNPFRDSMKSIMYNFPGKGKNDFEAMIKSNTGPNIWIFCKDCNSDKGNEVASVYSFNLESMSFDNKPKKVLNATDLKSILNEKELKNIRIKPSAIAYHPIEHHFYLLSSSDNWLMVLDQQLTPKEFYKLDPAIFKQAEGITFSPDGTLFISNEARGGKPTLLSFPYTPSMIKD